MKDFIKLGLDFVSSHPDADQQLDLNIKAVAATGPVLSCSTDLVEQTDDNLADTNNKQQKRIVCLSQVDIQVDNEKTPKLNKKAKKKKKKKKDQERLLSFQEKLQSSGLPPSRLMEQQRKCPDLLQRNLEH